MNSELDILQLLMGLGGGLALFLFGMDQMANALKSVAGDRMKSVLAKLTSNRFVGAITGAFVTAVIQSSSVTTVLVVGFVSAGLMSLGQAIGVIMGANIGTTFTAQIIAFKVTHYALAPVAIGFAMMFVGRRERIREYGAMVMGLGLLFFGMGVMSDAMSPLRDQPLFRELMLKMEAPALGILVGAVFTALIQASAATTGIAIVLAGQGLITLPAGIAIALGANIGTCVTAMLGAIGKPREAVRAAVVHVLFNVVGVLIWVFFLEYLARGVVLVSPSYPELSGMARLSAETPRQIANAHTVFNVVNTLLFIGFTGTVARVVEWMVPDRPLSEEGKVRPRYLNDALISTPSLALNATRLEMSELGGRVKDMLAAILPQTLAGTREGLQEVAKMDVGVDQLHDRIVEYLRRVGASQLSQKEADELLLLMEVANTFENMGDIIETDLVTLGQRRIEEQVTISQSTREVIHEVHAAVLRAVEMAVIAVSTNNVEAAQAVLDMKSSVNRLSGRAMRRGVRRLIGNEPRKLQAYTREMEMIEKLKRIYYFAKRAAKTLVDEEEFLKDDETETPAAPPETDAVAENRG